jgi:hypothetical protein
MDACKSEDMIERLIPLEKIIAGPKRRTYAAICTKKWNLGLEMRMLGAHCAVIVRKSSRTRDNSAYTRDWQSERIH